MGYHRGVRARTGSHTHNPAPTHRVPYPQPCSYAIHLRFAPGSGRRDFAGTPAASASAPRRTIPRIGSAADRSPVFTLLSLSCIPPLAYRLAAELLSTFSILQALYVLTSLALRRPWPYPHLSNTRKPASHLSHAPARE
ncbi:hypothetical protein BC628DRAFT_440809 [Trametes gibbosa]|nr:hypothetical protein BC628DRAFT_440809 [Trametes gibbosa]